MLARQRSPAKMHRSLGTVCEQLKIIPGLCNLMCACECVSKNMRVRERERACEQVRESVFVCVEACERERAWGQVRESVCVCALCAAKKFHTSLSLHHMLFFLPFLLKISESNFSPSFLINLGWSRRRCCPLGNNLHSFLTSPVQWKLNFSSR